MENPVRNAPAPTPNDNSQPVRGTGEAEQKRPETAVREAGEDLSQTVSEIAGDAKDAVLRKSEDVKQGLSGSLKEFGGALRAAGDHLSESGQNGSSRFVSNAASGLEKFAGSLESKPLGEVIDDLRSFGRENAGALFAGSMLAGLALGRVLKSMDSDTAPTRQPSARNAGGPPSRDNSSSVAGGRQPEAPPASSGADHGR